MKTCLKVIIILLVLVAGVIFVGAMRSAQQGDAVSSDHLAVPLLQGSYFGDPVMLGEDVLIVGVYDGGGAKYRYTKDLTKDLYIFEKNASAWSKTQVITRSDIQEYHPNSPAPNFNLSVLHDNTLIVPGGDSEKTYLYIFEKQNFQWKHVSTDLIADIRSNTSAFETTGSRLRSFSYFGTILTLGFHDDFSYATRDSVGGTTRPDDIYFIDSVLVFEKSESGWQKTYRLATHIDDESDGPYTNIDEDSWRWFSGASVMDENTLIIGADAGDAVFIFKKESNVWNQELEISKNKGEGFLYVDLPEERNKIDFGHSIALDGNTLALGMPGYGNYVNNESEQIHGDFGAVYLFEDKGNGWEQMLRISRDNDDLSVSLDPVDNFGGSVALFGNLLAVGAPNDGEVTNSGWFGGCIKTGRGAVYLFERDEQSEWSQVLKISDEKDKASMWNSLCQTARSRFERD